MGMNMQGYKLQLITLNSESKKYF